MWEISKFRAKHSRVSNPSLCLSDRGVKLFCCIKVIFIVC